MENDELYDPDFNPYDLLEELAIEVQRLNQRQLHIERAFQELANNQAAIAQHLAHLHRLRENGKTPD